MKRNLYLSFLFACSLQFLSIDIAQAQTGFFSNWENRVRQTSAGQPGWIVPVITSSSGLVQLVRADIVRQYAPTGTLTMNYDNSKGVECYERLKNKGPMGASYVDPLSTGITYALLERAAADKIPLITMGYGRADASYGPVFPFAFTYPATYWDSADAMITYIAGKEGGFDKLKGKKIALVYHDSAYGKEPIATLEKLAAQDGFKFDKFAVSPPGIEQKSTWLQIRQLKPNWVLMWGWGVMNSTAIREAAAVGFPMDHFIGIWYSGSEDDTRPVGAEAKGYTALNFNRIGASFPAIQDIVKYVVDKGLSQVAKDKVGENYYNRGVYNSVLISEAIRNAQRITGKKVVTGEDVRRGLEALSMTEARWKELGLPGFGGPITGVSCTDHNGHQSAYMQQWDGAKWMVASDWITPMKDRVRPLLEAAAKDYVSKDPAWPKRTEPCDKSS